MSRLPIPSHDGFPAGDCAILTAKTSFHARQARRHAKQVRRIPETGYQKEPVRAAPWETIRAAKASTGWTSPHVVHKSFLFFAGESIAVHGSGIENALINLGGLARNDIPGMEPR